MGSVGLLILFAIVGAAICAKARSALGAIAFSIIGLILFISTPVGDGLPGAIESFMSGFDQAATLALNQEQPQRAGTDGSDR
ncbi:hypothetical protein [Pseudonocardia sp. HH130629-09]|uniref:hypothetical protein n=1 Tax=Pseudonocardia sp. HH130629-09 TaxID=1641402 RepID=UPI0006CB63E8|nr:hypothetical protein [Pseudonocardia sp. HH130629-09]ALE82466.1 hypothetical protein XF36_04335 [Pseudonocardia sp. HH130629-09]